MTATAFVCSRCGAATARGDHFCEQCGGRLGREACRACGAGVDEDGFCVRCGVRARAPGARLEFDVDGAAAVSDRGRVRPHNEDALYLDAGGPGVAAVVCDGISASTNAADAATRAAEVAGSVLSDAVRGDAELRDAMATAMRVAQAAVAQLAVDTPMDPPACTLVAAVWRADELIVGWAGDSRAYLDSQQLTTDDAEAHAVTRWLGADAPEVPPHIVATAAADGRLVLCTDGLWNYPSAMAELRASGPPPVVAGALVQRALDAGGSDNITVIVVELPLAGRAAA